MAHWRPLFNGIISRLLLKNAGYAFILCSATYIQRIWRIKVISFYISDDLTTFNWTTDSYSNNVFHGCDLHHSASSNHSINGRPTPIKTPDVLYNITYAFAHAPRERGAIDEFRPESRKPANESKSGRHHGIFFRDENYHWLVYVARVSSSMRVFEWLTAVGVSDVWNYSTSSARWLLPANIALRRSIVFYREPNELKSYKAAGGRNEKSDAAQTMEKHREETA